MDEEEPGAPPPPRQHIQLWWGGAGFCVIAEMSRDAADMLGAGVIKRLCTPLDLCVSSLCRGHANLLCIVPILTDYPRRESNIATDNNGWHELNCRCL